MAKREIKRWITINGVHVPIYEGSSVKEAVNNFINKVSNTKTIEYPKKGFKNKDAHLDKDEKTKQDQIKKSEEQKKQLNEKSSVNEEAKFEAIKEAFQKQASTKNTTYEVMEKDGKYVVVGGNNNGREDPGSWHAKKDDYLERGYKPLPQSDYKEWKDKAPDMIGKKRSAINEDINKAAEAHVEKIWNGGAANKEMYDAADKIAEKYGLDKEETRREAMEVMNKKYAESVQNRKSTEKKDKDEDWFEQYKKIVNKGSGKEVDNAKEKSFKDNNNSDNREFKSVSTINDVKTAEADLNKTEKFDFVETKGDNAWDHGYYSNLGNGKWHPMNEDGTLDEEAESITTRKLAETLFEAGMKYKTFNEDQAAAMANKNISYKGSGAEIDKEREIKQAQENNAKLSTANKKINKLSDYENTLNESIVRNREKLKAEIGKENYDKEYVAKLKRDIQSFQKELEEVEEEKNRSNPAITGSGKAVDAAREKKTNILSINDPEAKKYGWTEKELKSINSLTNDGVKVSWGDKGKAIIRLPGGSKAAIKVYMDGVEVIGKGLLDRETNYKSVSTAIAAIRRTLNRNKK